MTKQNKSILKKWWIWVIAFTIAVTIGCSSGEGGSENTKKQQDDLFEKEIEVNEELTFKQYNINFGLVKIYKEENKIFADMKFDWRSKRLPDKTSLFVATMFDVKQGDIELEEVNDSWNPMGERKSTNDVFFPNASGGVSSVRLTYELIDDETPIEITFTPTTEEEESETITININ